MLDLKRAWDRATVRAEPLPTVWSNLDGLGIQFRRGWLHLVASAPNTGKSMFAMVYALKAGVPTLFFSADTDLSTMRVRCLAHLSGHSQKVVEQNLMFDEDYYNDEEQHGLSHIKWVGESNPSLDDVSDELDAWIELYSTPPSLIVIDNLMNVAAETDNEWAGLRRIMADLHGLAHKSSAALMVLHHVSEAAEYKSMYPPPMRSIQGKVSQLPEVIVTLAHDPARSELKVAAVKNRSGQRDTDGGLYTTLFTNYACCQIEDTTEIGRAWARHNEGVAV